MSSSERRGKRKGDREEIQGKGRGRGEGGPHHVICEDKLMQTLLGQFGIKIRIIIIKNNNNNETEKGETSNIVLCLCFVKDFPLCPFTEKVFYK